VEGKPHNRFLTPHAHLAATFGGGTFGKFAEATARFFGTPQYLLGQTAIVVAWVILNATGVVEFDVYPFILLNLAFSLQAAYAAPMILLAETRQSERDKAWSDADARHREDLASSTITLLEQNTELTKQVEALSRQVHALTAEIHARIFAAGPAAS
jgi:uncharacterized membrane protein